MKTVLTLLTGLVAGIVLAMFGNYDPPAENSVSLSSPLTDRRPAIGVDTSLERRVAELERALAVEREARQMLEDEIFLITRDVADVGLDEQPDADGFAQQADRELRSVRGDGQRSREYRITGMVEAGIDHAKAEWILQRESELQFEALQMRYDAGRNSNINEFYSTRPDLRNMLRQEIGDADFERYLAANGMATSVVVSSVLDASPARAVGLQPGDRIVRYNGQRVFSMGDISRQIMQGTPGESVVLEFQRDGIPMQVQLPRGPVGISGGSG